MVMSLKAVQQGNSYLNNINHCHHGCLIIEYWTLISIMNGVRKLWSSSTSINSLKSLIKFFWDSHMKLQSFFFDVFDDSHEFSWFYDIKKIKLKEVVSVALQSIKKFFSMIFLADFLLVTQVGFAFYSWRGNFWWEASGRMWYSTRCLAIWTTLFFNFSTAAGSSATHLGWNWSWQIKCHEKFFPSKYFTVFLITP